MREPALQSLFRPKTIAVIGVSENISKLGTIIYNNILKGGYPGKVFPVNPKYSKVFNETCYHSISSIDHDIDLAIIVIPAEYVLDAAKDCVRHKVKNVIVISAGFSEIGEEGKKLENELAKILSDGETRLLGPNCLGLIVPALKLNASFAAQMPNEGNIAFTSQSGAFNTAILDMAEECKLGFSHFISMGNKADLNEMIFSENFINDANVKVMGIYLEEFEDGKNFIDLIKEKNTKPIVLLHPGDTKEAQSAISSHTGSLAGSSEVIGAALKQAGITQVKTIEKMFAAMMLFSWGKLPKGPNVGIVTNAGGPGIMLTDMIINEGLNLAKLSAITKEDLRKILPSTANVNNPVDVIGDADAERYTNAVIALEKDTNVDVIIVLLTPQLVTQIEETSKFLINYYQISTKPIIPVFIGGKYVSAGLQRLFDHQIPAFQYPEEAISGLKYLVNYSNYLKNKEKSINIKSGTGKFTSNVNQHTTAETKSLPQTVSRIIASEFSLDLPKEKIINSIKEAEDFAKETGFPLVLKALSEDITHKTDVKALYLGIENLYELRSNYEKLIENIIKASGNTQPKVLIQEQIEKGEELFVGANRDGDKDVYTVGKGFGHLIVFGKGGIYTEVYKDISSNLIPLSKENIIELIKKTKVSKIIEGARGLHKLSEEKLVETIEKVQQVVIAYPQIVSLDINPLILTTDRCIAVDIKIFVKN